MKKSTFAVFSVIVLVIATCSAVFGGVVGAVVAGGSDLFGNGNNLLDLPGGSRTEVSIINEQSAIIDVAANASDSVVSIIITRELTNLERRLLDIPEDESRSQQIGSGSGFVITEDGIIITNRHVVEEEGSTYTVVFTDGSRANAEVLGRDPLLDIAILKIDPAGRDLQPLPIGDSDEIRVGQTVIAIGNSLGRFSNTVSTGIISGLARNIVASDQRGLNAERLTGVIQTDASINPGNSGGPLLDIGGNVIGVNVAVAQDAENIGFAIPINLVIPAIESIQEFGEIRRPLLGVRYQEVNPTLAEELNLPVNFGALIEEGENGDPAVVEGSAASEAGLTAGDLIVSINGVELNMSTSLQTEIQKLAVGDTVEIGFYRDGQLLSATATLKSLTE